MSGKYLRTIWVICIIYNLQLKKVLKYTIQNVIHYNIKHFPYTNFTKNLLLENLRLKHNLITNAEQKADAGAGAFNSDR